jgi:hypothetical protein
MKGEIHSLGWTYAQARWWRGRRKEDTVPTRLLRTAAILLLATVALYGNALAAPRSAATTVAPARVYFLDSSGHQIRRVRANHTIQFVLQFSMPASFPAGYTDLRFTVFAHHKAQRTIIYGTPKHVVPGATLRVAVLVPISKAWIGQATVVGTVTLMSKPNGVELHHAGRGTANLTVLH